MQQQCHVCHGEGHVIKRKCSHCHGHGVYQEEVTLEVNIPHGAPDGAQVTLPLQGHQVCLFLISLSIFIYLFFFSLSRLYVQLYSCTRPNVVLHRFLNMVVMPSLTRLLVPARVGLVRLSLPSS